MIISMQENWDKAFEQAVKATRENRTIIYPTDTLYGFGGNALNEDVAKKAKEIAGTQERICVIIANLEMLLKYFDMTGDEMKFMTQSCPGPYVFMLKPKMKMHMENEKGMVGVMIPNNVFTRKVCFEANVPLAMAQCDASEISGLAKAIVEKADVAIDGGKTILGKEATIVNIRERRIERQGAAEFKFE